MAKLSIRVDLSSGARLGPGKIALLEQVLEQGSISAAARSMGMSYRRAWELIEDLNASFEDVVVTKVGGKQGGGAAVTPLGRELVERYRAVIAKAEAAALPELEAIQRGERHRNSRGD
jgi:molybdate transport system regulatory protein